MPLQLTYTLKRRGTQLCISGYTYTHNVNAYTQSYSFPAAYVEREQE